MTYAATLTVLSGAEDDAVALAAAAKFAKASQGVASCFLALPNFLYVSGAASLMGGSYMSPALIDALQKDNADIRKKTRAAIRGLAERDGPAASNDSWQMILLEDQPLPQMNLDAMAPLCDLLIVAPLTLDSAGIWSGVFSEGVMQARLPLLVARRPHEDGVAAIAWDGSLAAGRAVRAALPILKAASKVVLLQDPEALQRRFKATADPNRLTDYLNLHGVKVASVIRQNNASKEGRMAALCRDLDVETLVSGAYGHARLLEELVGGCTDTLLNRTQSFNLFLAH